MNAAIQLFLRPTQRVRSACSAASGTDLGQLGAE